MAKTKVKYYLDTTDQIEVDGHTLSRLYLAEAVPNPFRDEGYSKYAIFGEDNTKRAMGGYVENLDILSKNVSAIDEPAWVYADSKVYGNSRIAAGAKIHNTTVVDSKINNYTPASNIFDSTIVGSTVDTVRNSLITDSTCDKWVEDSIIENSTIKSKTFSSSVKNSTLTGTKNSYIKNADLENVKHHGSIAGTFSNIKPGDITIHSISMYDKDNFTIRLNLLEGPNGESALTKHDEYSTIITDDLRLDWGDIILDEFYDILTSELNGKMIGKPETIKTVESIRERQVSTHSDLVLTDSDLYFGDSEIQL